MMVFCVEGNVGGGIITVEDFSIGIDGTEFVVVRFAVVVVVSCPFCLFESNVNFDKKYSNLVNIYLYVHCYSLLFLVYLSFESELLYQEYYSMKQIVLLLIM